MEQETREVMRHISVGVAKKKEEYIVSGSDVRALSPVLCGIALRGGRCVCNAPKCLLDTSALRFYYTLMRCKVASCLEKNPGSIVL
jgi:hypothetical protein